MKVVAMSIERDIGKELVETDESPQTGRRSCYHQLLASDLNL